MDANVLSKVFDQKRLQRRPYFFLNGDLHKRLYIHRGRDILLAWNYRTGEEVKYLYSDWKRNSKRAYTPTEVAMIIGRHRARINYFIQEGRLAKPQRTYSLDEERRPGRYYYQEEEILEIHELFCQTKPRGVTRKDGKDPQENTLTPRSEVQRILAGGKVLYRVDSKGNYIPVWKA